MPTPLDVDLFFQQYFDGQKECLLPTFHQLMKPEALERIFVHLATAIDNPGTDAQYPYYYIGLLYILGLTDKQAVLDKAACVLTSLDEKTRSAIPVPGAFKIEMLANAAVFWDNFASVIDSYQKDPVFLSLVHHAVFSRLEDFPEESLECFTKYFYFLHVRKPIMQVNNFHGDHRASSLVMTSPVSRYSLVANPALLQQFFDDSVFFQKVLVMVFLIKDPGFLLPDDWEQASCSELDLLSQTLDDSQVLTLPLSILKEALPSGLVTIPATVLKGWEWSEDIFQAAHVVLADSELMTACIDHVLDSEDCDPAFVSLVSEIQASLTEAWCVRKLSESPHLFLRNPLVWQLFRDDPLEPLSLETFFSIPVLARLGFGEGTFVPAHAKTTVDDLSEDFQPLKAGC